MPPRFDIITPRIIRTPRLLLRPFTPTDTPALVEAITASLDHLRTFMPWALNEPQPVEKKVQLILQWMNEMNTGGSAIYGIFLREHHDQQAEAARAQHRIEEPGAGAEKGGGVVIGSIGIHHRIGAGGGEIGYWIHADHTNKGYTTEAAAALTRIGLETLDLRWMEIQCDVANTASNIIPERLGFSRTHTIANRIHTRQARPATMHIWTLRREQFESSPAALRSREIEAFDALGRSVSLHSIANSS